MSQISWAPFVVGRSGSADRELLIYVFHATFWVSFWVAGLVLKKAPALADAAPEITLPSERQAAAPYSRWVLAVHCVAFALLYFGLSSSINVNRVPEWLPGQRILGALIVLSGAGLACWARLSFQSWRFRAKLDAGHQLASGGPFRYLRHPIYMGLNLLALGSAVWDPTVLTWAAVALMVVGSDLRGRAEERLLSGAFGQTYVDYMQRTRRFVPGLY